MNSRSCFLLILAALAVLSSGCMGGQDSEQELLTEGTRLTYDDQGYGNTTYTFFNGTEDTIWVREEGEDVAEFYTVYRENLSSQEGKNFPIGATNLYAGNRTQRMKIRKIMDEGGTTDIYRGSEKVLEVTRSEEIVFEGLEAYRVTFESEAVTFKNLVTVERPYLLLNSSSSRGGGLSLVKIERNVEMDKEDYRDQEERSVEEEISSNVKASGTELEFSAVYSTENEDGERRISVIVRNTGERDIQPEKFNLTYSPVRYKEFKAFEKLHERWKTGDTCRNAGVVRPQGSFQCHTGLMFPSPDREVGIKLESTEFDYEVNYTCSPATEDSRTC